MLHLQEQLVVFEQGRELIGISIVLDELHCECRGALDTIVEISQPKYHAVCVWGGGGALVVGSNLMYCTAPKHVHVRT